jgi:hypothetical protein
MTAKERLERMAGMVMHRVIMDHEEADIEELIEEAYPDIKRLFREEFIAELGEDPRHRGDPRHGQD